MRLKQPLTAEVTNHIEKLISDSKTPGDAKRAIADYLGISTRRAHEYYKHVLELSTPSAASVQSKEVDESAWEKSLLLDGDYVYNKDDDRYIVYLRSANRHIVVPGDKHRAMLQAYSNWDGMPATINEICRNFEFPRAWFIEYKTIMGWTHDREPVTNEELKNRSEDSIIEDLLQRKRFAIYQRFQREDWKDTQADANKWREFKAKQLDPFVSALSNWQPPVHSDIPVIERSVLTNNTNTWFVCGCFDWQIGAKADSKYLFRQSEWDTDKAKKAIDTYAYKITYDIMRRQQNFAGCELLLGGDLHHGFHGKTAKGTVLEMDTLREEQFDALFSSLVYFIGVMHQLFDIVNVRAVRGNHDGFDFYPVMKAVEAYYRGNTSIKFHIYNTRTALFRIASVLVLLDHGASDTYKAEIPRKGKERESYIQSLLLAHPEHLIGVKQKIFIQGDKHHYEQYEYNDFEAFMFGALPLGDKYADNLNLNSRPRQNCLIIDENGVKEVLHYYFD